MKTMNKGDDYMFYLEYNLELSEESDFDYYVLHFNNKKVYEDSHVYNKRGGYVMLKVVNDKYMLLNEPVEHKEEVNKFVNKLNS